MYVQKTKETDVDSIQFIESVKHPQKRQDAYRLLELFEQTSGFPPKM